MKMKYWSEHEKYIVMVDGNSGSISGARLGYQAFLAFKRVKEALIAMSKGEGNYSYDPSDKEGNSKGFFESSLNTCRTSTSRRVIVIPT